MRSWLACLAVAMLLLALSMEHVNAVWCPAHYRYDASIKSCFRLRGSGTYEQAVDTCATEGGTVTSASQLDHLRNQLTIMMPFWILGNAWSCHIALPGTALFNRQYSPCSFDYMFVCVWSGDWVDNPENCICTLHDDPLLETCDAATITIYGENMGFRFMQSSEYASEQCLFQVDFHLGDDQALTKIFIKMKDTKIWMYADGIREGNENAALDPYVTGTNTFDQPLSTAGNSGQVQEGDITVSYDVAEDLATYTSAHCQIQFEFRASPKPLLKATIGERYDNALKWLCGDFNGNRTDDYRTGDGDVVYNEPDRYLQISNYAKENVNFQT